MSMERRKGMGTNQVNENTIMYLSTGIEPYNLYTVPSCHVSSVHQKVYSVWGACS
jgi:hypothetical protein